MHQCDEKNTYKVLRTPKQLRKELDAGLRVEAGPVNQVVKNISGSEEKLNFSIEEARLTKVYHLTALSASKMDSVFRDGNSIEAGLRREGLPKIANKS